MIAALYVTLHFAVFVLAITIFQAGASEYGKTYDTAWILAVGIIGGCYFQASRMLWRPKTSGAIYGLVSTLIMLTILVAWSTR